MDQSLVSYSAQSSASCPAALQLPGFRPKANLSLMGLMLALQFCSSVPETEVPKEKRSVPEDAL